MDIRHLATEAYLRVEALEELLVAKGIIAEGEAEQHKLAIIKEKSDRHEALLKEFWNRIEDGDGISYTLPGGTYFWRGEVLAKSSIPYQALTVRIIDRGTSKYKAGQEYTILNVVPPDFRVRHGCDTGSGIDENPPEWGV